MVLSALRSEGCFRNAAHATDDRLTNHRHHFGATALACAGVVVVGKQELRPCLYAEKGVTRVAFLPIGRKKHEVNLVGNRPESRVQLSFRLFLTLTDYFRTKCSQRSEGRLGYVYQRPKDQLVRRWMRLTLNRSKGTIR